jgi:hypothetical protein
MFLLALSFAVSSRAVAADPPSLRFVETAEGGWQVVVGIPVPEPEVRAALVDPIASARFAPDIHSIAYVEQGRPCSTLDVETSGFASVAYVYRRCPTADGWHETLVTSGSLDAYEVRWRLVPQGNLTEVTYMVRVEPHLPAPDFIVGRQVRSTMSAVMTRLYTHVTTVQPPTAGVISGAR